MVPLHLTELGIIPVIAGLGVNHLVEARNFESISVSSLSFVHVVSEGQNHLQELTETVALDHLCGGETESWKKRQNEKRAMRKVHKRGSARSEHTFNLGFDFGHSVSEFLLEVKTLESLLVVVDSGLEEERI